MMITRNISVNKNEFNVRKIEELNDLIIEKERELRSAEGFINKFKLRFEIRKLYKLINKHGEEVLEFEYNQANNIQN